jgi:hypothetical protein
MGSFDPGALAGATGADGISAGRRQRPSDSARRLIAQPAEIAQLREANTRRLQRQRHVEEIERRGGARLHFEAWDHAIRHGMIAEGAADEILALFARADPALLAAVGGDRMPAGPLHLVAGRER